MNQADRFYIFITVFLIIALAVGGVMLLTNRNKIQPVELVLSQAALPQQGGEVYIGGAVVNPGIYPLREGETIQALLWDVGLELDADLDHIAIYIPEEGEEQSPQRVDINRAEPWLLEALPGIGETRAEAIVDYRNENGEFKRVEDLLQVKGIGEKTFDKIKDYITVSDSKTF
jgi:competence protein ComEA